MLTLMGFPNVYRATLHSTIVLERRSDELKCGADVVGISPS